MSAAGMFLQAAVRHLSLAGLSARARARFGASCLAAAAVLLAGCERPPVDTVQRGYRGLGMEQVYNPRTLAAQAGINTVPPDSPPAAPGGPPASAVFKNVQVLGDLGVGEFTRLMVSITSWVSPAQGCTYCHVPGEDFSADTLFTKVVSRSMLQMNRQINTDWKSHVSDTGVTCYTCHRGYPVPPQLWSVQPPHPQAAKLLGNDAGQNRAAASVNLSSLPYDPFTPFLSGASEIRVVGGTALPSGNRNSIKHAEFTYGLMMHMSQSLGVNCTYCHTSRSFAYWDSSTPQRGTAWYGIRMVRDLNANYVDPLAATLPPERLGPMGDTPKVNCATCHQGAYKPLYGAKMLKDHPALLGPAPAGAGPAGTSPAGASPVPPGALPGAPPPAASPDAPTPAAVPDAPASSRQP